MYFLDPIDTDNTVSKQLKKITGDHYSSLAFYSAHDPSQTTSAGVLVHRKTGKEIFLPFKADPKEDGENRCIEELKRIALFENGCGGYQWGDWRNADGNFGGTRLDKLEEFGLAERTGKSARNNMGGSWPEVRVTDLGMQVIEAERRQIGRNLNTKKLLDDGLIPKSILLAAEYARDYFGATKDSVVTVRDIMDCSEYVWGEMEKNVSGLENYGFDKGHAWLVSNLESFTRSYADYSSEPFADDLIKLSPEWHKEVGTQVKATFFKNTGKYYSEGIVNLPGAEAWNRESVLDAFRENQKILTENFYDDDFTVVMMDTPANNLDPLYKEMFTRMTPAADFAPQPDAKLNQKRGLDNLAP